VHAEDAPRREGIKRPWLRTSSPKNLNENLAPLRRYLLSNVGRPWDKVFSEMSRHMRLDSAVQLHIWQHVQDDVCFGAVRVRRDEYVNSRGEELREEFLVEARTGLLRKNPQYGKGPRYYSIQRPAWMISPFEQEIEIDELHRYARLDGIWYLVTLAPMPPEGERAGLWDVARHEAVLDGDKRKFYYTAKRQLNSKEIRKLPASAVAAREE
jgi:hypothetical protein